MVSTTSSRWQSPRVIVDLGSHIGASILRLRAAYPQARIYGFEPDPATFSRLASECRTAARCHGSAMGDRRHRWTPRVLSPAAVVAVFDVGDGPAASRLTVESVALDTALTPVGIAAVDLMKIDVEGAEGPILRRFHGLERVRMIVGELHGQAACDEVLGLLAAFEVETRGHPDHCHFRARG